MIGILDVGIGNMASLRNALENQGWGTLNVAVENDLRCISHLILPGVGSYFSAMQSLRDAKLLQPIYEFAAAGMPVMGICLGMQLLSTTGVEGGYTDGLNLIPGEVVPLISSENLRLPHVGWNTANQLAKHPVLSGVKQDVDFYFVHNYYFKAKSRDSILAETTYGSIFPSIVGQKNIIGLQFHPEKSQYNGLKIIDNFCTWDGLC